MKTVTHEPLEFDVLASDLGFPEGPVILDDDTFLAVDIEGGRVVRVADGRVSVVATPGGGPNGLALADSRRWSWRTTAGSCGRRSTASASRSTTPHTRMSRRDSRAGGWRVWISLRRGHPAV